MINSEAPVAHVVAAFDSEDERVSLLVLCPYCRRRHLYSWDGIRPLGTCRAHCDIYRRYQIGAVPDRDVLEAVRRARQSSSWLLFHPWSEQCNETDIERIKAAAFEFADAVAEAAIHLEQPTEYPRA